MRMPSERELQWLVEQLASDPRARFEFESKVLEMLDTLDRENAYDKLSPNDKAQTMASAQSIRKKIRSRMH